MAVPELGSRGALTRRQLLKNAGAVAALTAAGGLGIELLPERKPLRSIRSYAVKPAGAVRTFHTRPDLKPPTVTITDADHDALIVRGRSPDYLFLGPGPNSLSSSQEYGPLIVDHRGEPVWFKPRSPGVQVANFQPWTFRGDPVLVWWEGQVHTSGYGQGEVVMVDDSYSELTRIRAANGRVMDFHGFCLTPHGTALFTCYPETVNLDLRPLGGPKQAPVYESTIQEIDIASGRLLFEWKSLQHVPVTDSYESLGRDNYDYLHINAISLTPDGQLLVSGRHAWALYKLDRRSGEVIWRLGGKRSQFRVGKGAAFAWQHDPKQLSDRLLTVFDNGTNGPILSEPQSRALLLDIDEAARTVSLRKAYTHSPPLKASAMGSVQVLESGRIVVGWGTAGHATQFDSSGKVLFDAALPSGTYSFRALWEGWKSEAHKPAIAAGHDSDYGSKVLYASWNGATGVAGWRVDAGLRPAELQALGVARRKGFETVIPLHPDTRFASVTAVDHRGRALKASQTIRV